MDSGTIGSSIDKLIGILAGVAGLIYAAKIKKTTPEKTITLLKPIPLYQFLYVCSVVVIANFTLQIFLR